MNTIAPIAGSRMTETVMPEDLVKALKPAYVSPLVTYLVSEECEENGSVFEVGAGWMAKLRWERTKGAFLPLNKPVTAEGVRDNWGAVTDFSSGTTYPSSTQDAFPPIMENMNTIGAEEEDAASSSSSAGSKLKSAPLFAAIADAIKKDGASFVKKVKGIIVFDLKDAQWTVDLKNGTGSVTEGRAKKSDITITVSDENFVKMASGKLNPQQAFMGGKIKIKGNMGLAMKLGTVMKAAQPKANL